MSLWTVEFPTSEQRKFENTASPQRYSVNNTCSVISSFQVSILSHSVCNSYLFFSPWVVHYLLLYTWNLLKTMEICLIKYAREIFNSKKYEIIHAFLYARKCVIKGLLVFRNSLTISRRS